MVYIAFTILEPFQKDAIIEVGHHAVSNKITLEIQRGLEKILIIFISS